MNGKRHRTLTASALSVGLILAGYAAPDSAQTATQKPSAASDKSLTTAEQTTNSLSKKKGSQSITRTRSKTGAQKRRIVYNDDSQGVYECRPDHAKEDLEAWVDKPFSRIPIDTYSWCIAFPDICMHNTKAGEVYGARFAKPPSPGAETIAKLHAQGLDVLTTIADRAHSHGAEVVASVRMNDTHNMWPDPENAGVSRFLLDHPEWAIRRDDGIQETAMDYSFPGVREHRLAILRELAENYDVDGLELDFTRMPKFFPRQEAPFKIEIMTEFVKQVRTILDEASKKRGCGRLVLGVQTPQSLYLCHLSGLDPKAWIEQAQLDYIIQSDFNCVNPQIPTSEFAAMCKDTPCTHHVRMGNMMACGWAGKPFMPERKTHFNGMKGYGGMVLTTPEARGAAANIYGFGADGIGIWNACCFMGELYGYKHPGITRKAFQEDLFAWINAVATPEQVQAGARNYHFVPPYKTEKLLMRNYPVNDLLAAPDGALTQIVTFWPQGKGFREVYRFPMADGRNGEKLKGVLRFRILQSTREHEFAVDINRTRIDSAKVKRTFVPDDELPAVWYEIALADCPPFKGNNELGMTMTRIPEWQNKEKPPYMEELEIKVEL